MEVDMSPAIFRRFTLGFLAWLTMVLAVRAEEVALGPDPQALQEVVAKAAAFLKTRQGADGGFSPKLAGPGVSAIVAAGLIKCGVSPDDPLVAKSLTFIELSVQKDGGIYSKGLANYTTAVAVMA